MAKKYNIAYYRVSTQKQGESGLGLESQKAIVYGFLREDPDFEYTEIETGKNTERKQLAEAIKTCKKLGGRLVIANLSRLSRNAIFILQLMEAKVDFVCCDNPGANPLTIGLLAIIAEDYAKTVSINTANSLAALREREKLKNPEFRLGAPKGESVFEKGISKNGVTADEIRRLGQEAKELKWNKSAVFIIIKMHEEGKSLGEICRFLEGAGYKPHSGDIWYKSTIADKIKAEKKKLIKI